MIVLHYKVSGHSAVYSLRINVWYRSLSLHNTLNNCVSFGLGTWTLCGLRQWLVLLWNLSINCLDFFLYLWVASSCVKWSHVVWLISVVLNEHFENHSSILVRQVSTFWFCFLVWWCRHFGTGQSQTRQNVKHQRCVSPLFSKTLPYESLPR